MKPVHPAARSVGDGAERVMLGVSEAELRLACLHAVSPRGELLGPAAELVREADVLFRYVMGNGKDRPATDGALDASDEPHGKQSHVSAHNAKAAESLRPPLSEASRVALKQEARRLRRSAEQDALRCASRREVAAGSNTHAQTWAQAAASQFRCAEAIERDLGESTP